jgi:hypothetical protein
MTFEASLDVKQKKNNTWCLIYNFFVYILLEIRPFTWEQFKL